MAPLLLIPGMTKVAATIGTVIRSHVNKSKKSVTVGFGATRRPNNGTGFRTIV
jgi:hypothetical protein